MKAHLSSVQRAHRLAPAARSLKTPADTRRKSAQVDSELRVLPSVTKVSTNLPAGATSAPPSSTVQQSSISDSRPADNVAAIIPPVAPLVSITSALAFAILAIDVFDASSLHLLGAIDTSIHNLVSQNVHADFRLNVAASFISNAAIYPGVLALACGSVWALAKKPRVGVSAVSLTWAAYFLGAGYMKGGEPLLLDAVKEFFHRARPSEGHSSYAFPSGHSTAATFIIAALAFVICPLVLSSAAKDDDAAARLTDGQQQQRQEQQPAGGQPQAAAVLVALSTFCQVRAPTWCSFVACLCGQTHNVLC
jgi:membrane-associated phospholipid phosphatase